VFHIDPAFLLLMKHLSSVGYPEEDCRKLVVL
jgi:hypothetical protein